MIFVTVGTHEQPFNRLIKEIDQLKQDGIIKDEVFVQLGFSTYIPKFCQWSKLVSYEKMDQLINKADIVITHGGPATFMNVISKGKKPIVVPRQEKFGEHVNDHQLEFAMQVHHRYDNIIVLEDVSDISKVILGGGSFVCGTSESNNEQFNKLLKKEIEDLLN